MKKGIVVGCNKNLQWLLPWWWERYSYFCSLPVVFFDFGMTEEGLDFCKARGEVVTLEEIDPSHFSSETPLWSECYGKTYETARQGWFKKPLALAASPFEISLWLDLDCEVLADVDPIFQYATYGPFIALTREYTRCMEPYAVYNGGVILYRKNTPLIELFAREALVMAKDFWGDDRLLSFLIDREQFPVIEMDPICNWRYGQGIPAQAFILHWSGEWGKKYIKQFGGLFPFLRGSTL